MELFPVPAACSLPTTDQPLRVAEFEALFAGFLAGLERVDPTTLYLRFQFEPGLDRSIEELAARETACCSFFTFTLDRNDGLDLRVTVPGEYVEVLDGLQRLAQTAVSLEPRGTR